MKQEQWIKWFHEESANVNDDLDIVHYMIRTPNDVIDVLYTGETDKPLVRFV